MGQVAIDKPDLHGPDICSSVLPMCVQNLRLSIAISLTAHVAIAVALFSVLAPEIEAIPARGPDAFEISLVSPSVIAPLETPMEKINDEVPPLIEKAPPAPLQRAVELSQEIPNPIIPITPVAHSPAPASKAVKREVHDAALERTLSSQSMTAPVQEESYSSAGGEMARDVDLNLITKPRFRTPPRPPNYPKRARNLGQEGEALIRVRLDNNGNADEILIWKSSGFALLDNAALVAVRRWQFEPERRNGLPTIAWVQIPVHFSLN